MKLWHAVWISAIFLFILIALIAQAMSCFRRDLVKLNIVKYSNTAKYTNAAKYSNTAKYSNAAIVCY